MSKKLVITSVVVVLVLGGAVVLYLLTRTELPPGFACGNGRLEAKEIDIATKYPGRIKTVLADEGDAVNAGEIVATMDTAPFEAQLRAAEAKIREARDNRRTALAEVTVKQTELVYAAKEYKRSKELVVRGAIKAVTQRYGNVVALDSVDLEIPARRMIGLIGPDGVEKSTLLGMIAAVRRIQAGDVRVLDTDMADARFRNSVFARVAYMPQGLGRNLYPTLSIFENIDFFGRLFGQSREEREWRIGELFASTDLTPFRDRPAGKLSGGMKQKLGLCCSLIDDPDLLISRRTDDRS